MVAARQYSRPWDDYALIDAGDGRKLERFGSAVLIRPELQAGFKPGMSIAQWHELAHWEFVESSKNTGAWKNLKGGEGTAPCWNIQWADIHFKLELTRYKHVGLFPEQASNWQFIRHHLHAGDRFLNLFAYTGAASLVARRQGAEVCHVDSVRHLIAWAKENMLASDLSGIKWILDDALRFAQREVKRGNQYAGIIMDPPAFGLGAKGERWILEEKLPELLQAASRLLRSDGFLLVNTYSPKLPLATLADMGSRHFDPRQTTLSELRIKTGTGKDLFYGNILRVEKQ